MRSSESEPNSTAGNFLFFCSVEDKVVLVLLKKEDTRGPGPFCTSYEQSALTNQNKLELINNINERRNFVAMGHSKILPFAANMKKICGPYWSNELATSAQRWADQCDSSLYPDKEDQCRDLENVKVGQSIASILGPSPGLSVKSFVEMWFMQVVDYTGSVAYYNESQDYKTNHLTQLLWANTEYVGCGKSKFYVDERNTMVERLVCNFAPKGNAHRKPVYSVGYPGTQCRNNMKPDDKYHGLCAHEKDLTELMTQRYQSMNNLLRILNLSNESVKHEIDPIRNILGQNIANNNHSNVQRNQKTRHILPNKTNGSVKRMPHLRKQLFRNNNLMNISESNNVYHYQYDRGHSHLYHGHEAPTHNYDSTTIMNTISHFRRNEYTTEPTGPYSSTDCRKYNKFGQCTRRIRLNPENCAPHQCTKAPNECCQTTMCPSTCTEASCSNSEEPCPVPYIPLSPEPCECTHRRAPSPQSLIATTIQIYSLFYHYEIILSYDYMSRCTKPGAYQYYDLVPNAVQNGNKVPLNVLSPRTFNVENNKEIPKDQNSEHKSLSDISKDYLQNYDYIYHSLDHSGLRKQRQLKEHITVKPFWQIENPEIKLLRFTTLSNNLKTKKNRKATRVMTTTEPITVSYKNDASSNRPKHSNTEKYLSFDELMHLRKNNKTFGQTNLGARMTLLHKQQTHQNILGTHPFTGTANGNESSVGPFGSRTPPGYVDGCTRTSTCTREFMDRNEKRKVFQKIMNAFVMTITLEKREQAQYLGSHDGKNTKVSLYLGI
ncbi:hypothetical protein HW555_011478 [Spodoptera exigua]|uniref:SCP domain-containing protein n=1 Tax=Spodoptera exigua TaxID=7107 RepID=A0A835G6X3_SPOEX|nr:hypothetical protein HW555_011478 [Spodoptera exigua]